jgi:hypothetical protein
MQLRHLVVHACTLCALSACVVEPYGGRGYYGGGPSYYNGGDHGHHDDGHRVWRE